MLLIYHLAIKYNVVICFRIVKLSNFALVTMQNLFVDWSGKYSDETGMVLQVLTSATMNEMMIIIHQNTDMSPPSFVCHVNPVKFTFPFAKRPHPTYAVVRSDYKNISSDKVLQKIEIVNNSAPFKTDDVTITVYEFVQVEDFFDQIPPDDARKCKRKFKIRMVRGEVSVTPFWRYSYGCEVIVRKVEDIKIEKIVKTQNEGIAAEAEAAKLFRLFHEEMWLHNDGILIASLDKTEEEIRLGILDLDTVKHMQNDDQSGGSRVDVVSGAREIRGEGFVEDLKEEDEEPFVNQTDIVSFEYSADADSLLTEDELWERRDFDC